MSQTSFLNVTPSVASGADPVIEWNAITRAVIAADALPPDVAARVLAIESLAVYDAVAAVSGVPGFGSNLTAPSGASAQAAVIAAADAALDALFPAQAALFDAQATADLGPPGSAGEAAGVAAGQQAAAQVLAMRGNDGAGASVTDVGGVAPAAWQPTAPFYAPALTPQYATVTPFGLLSPNQFAPSAPPAIGSQTYAAAANQTFNLGALNSTTRSTAETQQALFWNDQLGTSTTAGQWNQIAATVAQANGESLSQDALLFAELNVAEADSAIAAANSGFADNVPRPVTLFTNPNLSILNPAIDGGSTWTPLLATPNSPGYPDGVSALSNAAATVLGNFFGSNTGFAATSQSDPGITLAFGSFGSAAADAAISQVYGGVQFSFSTDAGLSLGAQVGNWTLGLFRAATTPTVVLTTPSGSATSQDPTVTGFVSSGVTVLDARLPGGAMVAVPVSKDGSFSYTVPDPLGGTADGSQVVTFTAVNAASGQSPAANFTFDLLTQAPAITFASDSITATGTIGANAVLDGTVRLEPGDTLRSLSYSFDNGPIVTVPVDPLTGAFDTGLDDAALAPGQHQLTVTAVDIAGNTTSKTLTVTDALPFVLTGITPAAGAGDVGVAFRPTVTFSRAANPATVNGEDFYATDSSGAVLSATVIPFADGTGATLVPTTDVTAASAITLHVVGQQILAAADGAPLDAANAGSPGSSLTQRYETVSTVPHAGTTISGIVVDPGPDGTPFTPDDVTSSGGNSGGFTSDVWKLPIAGAKVYVRGDEAAAVTTAADGSFTLTNVPAGDATLVVDGTTATNAPAGYSFPVMTFNIVVKAGEPNTVAGDLAPPAAQAGAAADPAIYLPRLATDALTPVSGSAPATVTATADSVVGSEVFAPTSLSLTLQPGSIVGANGAPLASPTIGIVPVPASIVQGMLPPGPMQNSFMVSIQAPGASLFNADASMTLPNLAGLAPGEQTYIFSIDPATGRPVIVGTATASANGQTVTTDPGTRITAPGLYGMTPAGSNGSGTVGEPGNPGVAYPALLAAETQANQAALALVTSANRVIGRALAPAAPGAGMVGAATNATSGLAFAAAAGLGSDVAGAVSTMAADAQAITSAPTAAFGYATLAADALHDAANIAAALGGGLPGPTGTWASGLPAANAAVSFFAGMAATDAGLQANVATMSSGVPIADAMASFELALASADAQVAEQSGLYRRIASDLTTLSMLDPLNLTQPTLGVAAGQLASIDEQLPAIVNAFDDYMQAAQLLAGRPTALGVADQLASGLSLVEGAANTAAFQNISAATPGVADNALGAPVLDPGTAIYAAIQGSDGSIQRLSFTAGQGYQFFFAPNTTYQVTAFDSETNSIAQALVKTGASGQDSNVPLAGLVHDPAAVEADGLTPTEAFVIGVNGTTADNLVPGITDLAALREGLYGGSILPGATGVVASLPLPGTAEAIVLAGSSSGSTTYAYVATGGAGVAVVDVTHPDSPVLLGQLALGGNATGVAVSSVLGLAAVANGSGLALVDVANPAAPALVQTIPIAASIVRIIGGLAYANNGGALQSVDLATGGEVQALSVTANTITGIAVSGSTIYTMDSNDVLRVIDTSGGTMAAVGSVTLPSGGNQIFAANGVVYVGAASGSAQGGYLTVDVSNPSAPKLIAAPQNSAIAGAALVLNGSGTGVSVQQSATLGNYLSVFNAANPADTGQLISQFSLPAQPYDVALNGGVGFAADGSSGLQVVNYLPTDTGGVAPNITAVTGPADVDPTTAGTQVYAGAPITVTATVTDDVQVREVELLLNGSVIARATGFPFALTATMPSIATTATLQVAAIDTGGNATLSAPIPIQLVPDTRAFNIASENVTQGATLRPFVHAITLAFSKPVTPSSITASDIALLGQGDAAVAAQSMTLSDGNQVVSLNFGTLQPGTYELALTAPLIIDDNGGALGAGIITTGFTIEEFTNQFTSTTNASWNNAGNWSAGAVPGAADAVSVGANGGSVNYDGNTDSVMNLTVGASGALNVNAGQLIVTNALQVDGQVIAGGGALTAIGSVDIGAAGAVQVNNRSTTLDNVTIAAGGSILVANNNYLFASGRYANSGLIAEGSVGNDTEIDLAGNLTLTGAGKVQLSDNSQNYIAGAGGSATLTNIDNTIAGAGQIGSGVALNNATGGTIDATGASNSLVIATTANTNAGLMEATGPAGLVLRFTAITGPGTIAAPVANSVVDLQSASITGGTLLDANGGVIQTIDRGSVVNDVTVSSGSSVLVTNNNYLTFEGTLTNDGTVNLGSVGNDTEFDPSGPVTLVGAGTIQLSDNSQNYIASAGGSATLTNIDNTIAGAGQIGFGVALNNATGGTIDATGASNSLVIENTANTNAGLMEATGSGGLVLRSTSITGPGTIAAQVANSVVDLQSA